MMLIDTTPEMDASVLEFRRKQTPGQRISSCLKMSEFLRLLEFRVLRRQHLEAGEDESRHPLCVKRY